VNREEREKEKYNKQAGSQAHHGGYPYEEDHRDREPLAMHRDERNMRRGPKGDSGNLDKEIANLERMSADMAREMKKGTRARLLR
jgi:hypothetical protein